MSARNALVSMCLGFLCFVGAVDAQATAPDPDYPNELPGYAFHSEAPWRTIRPLVSREPEVTAQLGPLKASGYTFRRDWALVVSYWGKGGHCDGVPFPSFLEGTVAEIRLIPKARVSFVNVHFPEAFTKSKLMASHDRVGTFDRYEDEFGLAYEVSDRDSKDGSIRTGDLRAIVYGPSHRAYVTLTGCEL